MDELINTNRIILEYDANENEYRLSLFDKHFHYLDELYLAPEHLRDLIENGKELQITCEEDNL